MLARSPVEPLPIPGIVLGDYPERPRARAESSAPVWRHLLELLPLPSAGGERADFQTEVAARRALLEPLSDPSFQLIVDYLRKQLFHQGCERGPQAQAMACVGEAARRELGWVPYPAQISTASVLLQNRLAEMHTGEGKTFAIALAASVAAMAGIPVHVVTANEYLVARDAALFAGLYARLRLTVGTVLHGQDFETRRRAYACDITYCTARELAFDYLKDSLLRGRRRHDLEHRVSELTRTENSGPRPLLRGLCMAIVDEADSVLIDEAGTPLVLARSVQPLAELTELKLALRIARNLRKGLHFQVHADHAELSDAGRAVLEKLVSGAPSAWRDSRRREELVSQALSALHCHQRDRHYVLKDGKVCIVDQTTGRLAEGRSWSRGLHQLIELKEGCAPTGRQEPVAQTTFQRFFPRYLRLAGTSGTLREARAELFSAYGLRVAEVPLRTPGQRKDLGLRVVRDETAKWKLVVERIRALRTAGRPVLIGTDSVAASQRLSLLLTHAGIEHDVLNARQDQEEARIVSGAGQAGRVTVATNMAGRGTDIVLGEGVATRGGLHVISCQLNPEARIDRQLQGRAGRQGDPGSVETILSLDDPLVSRRLPRHLQRILPAMASRGGTLPRWLATVLTRTIQRLEGATRRGARRDLVRRDAFDERRLALTGGRE